MINSLPNELIEKNKLLFIDELKKTKRNNFHDLIDWLEKSDFFTSPASHKFHLNQIGGLCQHSLNVLKIARELNIVLNIKIEDNSIIITSLLHDLCKVNYYKTKEVWDREWKEKMNQWRKTEEFVVLDEQPLGHGEKSAILAYKYIDLTTEELVAIRWHLGAFEAGTHFSYPTGIPFKESLNKYLLLKLLILADMGATLVETKDEKKEEEITINKLF